MPLTQKQIDMRSGHDGTFWRNVSKQPDGKWIWTGQKNTNHNTVDCEKYFYGEFELVSKETSNFAKPTRVHASKMAHRISLFLTYHRPVPAAYDVFPFNGDHLDINPENLWIREKKTGAEVSAEKFFEVANDNDGLMRVAA
ncbi:hypothetical protein [Rhizobium leucaenae]|uniref:hypothetical protein n=1 Tax=Rhizobium leucaenae TaxID=29450 RepID=UPI001613DF01|nr:hypothetical protein [Rhizobium leucaenae]MBB6299924.1 hypothetical protein [Rhizobium leucaenae]